MFNSQTNLKVTVLALKLPAIAVAICIMVFAVCPSQPFLRPATTIEVGKLPRRSLITYLQLCTKIQEALNTIV